MTKNTDETDEGIDPVTTKTVPSLAKQHGPAAVAELVSSDTARVAAIKTLLDRGFDKPPKPTQDWIAGRTRQLTVKQLLADWAARCLTAKTRPAKINRGMGSSLTNGRRN